MADTPTADSLVAHASKIMGARDLLRQAMASVSAEVAHAPAPPAAPAKPATPAK
jgi:hypothetical protein